METTAALASPAESAEAASLSLDLHNKIRWEHDAPPLRLDSNLCEQAAVQALCIAKGMKPGACESAGIGRNIYRIQTSGPGYENYGAKEAMRDAIQTWYSHTKDYNWGNPSASPVMAKQFSQIIWKSAESLGVGVASRTDAGSDCRRLSVVINLYSPPGNVKSDDSYFENVLPRRGKSQR